MNLSWIRLSGTHVTLPQELHQQFIHLSQGDRTDYGGLEGTYCVQLSLPQRSLLRSPLGNPTTELFKRFRDHSTDRRCVSLTYVH
jgi:hypothetical protein